VKVRLTGRRKGQTSYLGTNGKNHEKAREGEDLGIVRELRGRGETC